MDAETFFDSVEKNNPVQLKKIIDSGFNINLKDKYGYSALLLASANGLIDIAKLLIESGIDLNIQDKKGQTMLHYAGIFNQPELAELALKKGADLKIEDKYGNQPLFTAILNDKGFSDRIDLVKLFLKNNADINHKNKSDKSPKDFVHQANYPELIKLLG